MFLSLKKFQGLRNTRKTVHMMKTEEGGGIEEKFNLEWTLDTFNVELVFEGKCVNYNTVNKHATRIIKEGGTVYKGNMYYV